MDKIKLLSIRAVFANPSSWPLDSECVPVDSSGDPVPLGEAEEIQFWPQAASALDGRPVSEVSVGRLERILSDGDLNAIDQLMASIYPGWQS